MLKKIGDIAWQTPEIMVEWKLITVNLI